MNSLELFDHQKYFLDSVQGLPDPARACLYYKTGAGKSLTALLGVVQLGHDKCLIIAPPSTHAAWEALAQQHGVEAELMSHAKFRMPTTKVHRDMPVIADEFHMFGGQKGKGWRKLDAIARGLRAPLLLLSATPNYNDVERIYCVQHIVNPRQARGGFLQFLYEHCVTKQNPFSLQPEVLSLRNYESAAEFLADLDHVFYLEDDLEFNIEEVPYDEDLPADLTDYMLDRRNGRMVASQMEMRHTCRYQGLVDEDDVLRQEVWELLDKAVDLHRDTVLIYANHATVAEAASRKFQQVGVDHAVITGKTPKKIKESRLSAFISGSPRVLIGTASLATGTDGMDKVCDTLVILDDTDDDALRRQLIGRIMPRGLAVPEVQAQKKILRLLPGIV